MKNDLKARTSRAKKTASFISTLRAKRETDIFGQEELLNELKLNKCTYPKVVIQGLLKEGMLVKKDNDYMFVSPEPVYYKTIKTYLDHASATKATNYKNSKVKELLPDESDPDSRGIDQKEAMVKFLLKSGEYRIFKKDVQWVQVFK